MLDKNIEIDIDSLDTELSYVEIFCCMLLFVVIVGFVFGFMVGVSY